MTKTKFMRVGILVICTMIVIGMGISIYLLLNRKKNVIKVNLDSEQAQNIEFKNLCLLPGEKCEYTVIVRRKLSKNCDVTLDFSEIEEQTLKNYVYAKIEVDDKTICDQLLSSLFEDENIVISVDFTKNKKTKIKICYYMLENVGNEAQNAEATFNLHIMATNKWGEYE